MVHDLREHRPAKAVALKLTAVFLFTTMAAMVKATADTVPPGQAVFFRSFMAIPVILVWLWYRQQMRTGLIPHNLKGHIWRGIIGTTGMALTFGGLGLLPLPEATAIGYAAPLFTVVFAAIFLGERIRLFRISAVGLGLVGVMIVLSPRLGAPVQDSATTGAMMILAATVFRAMAQIHIRNLVKTDQTAAIVFYFSLTASVLALFTLPFGWIRPDGYTLSMMVGTGLIGGLAQILITASYRYAPASMLAPFDYASMLAAIGIGYVWFDEVPGIIMLAGATLVIASGILIIWRERQLGLERNKTRTTLTPHG